MRSLLLACAIVLLPVTLRADAIGVYVDLSGSGCTYRDDASRPYTLTVIHKFNAGSTAARFRIEFSDAMTGTLVSVTSPHADVTGSPLTGVNIEFGGCMVGDHVVAELNMLFYGTSGRCSWIRVAAHPSSVDGMLDVYDCAAPTNREPASWEGTHVDTVDPHSCPSDGCGCHGGCCCRPYSPPLAVQSTTWGQIKALYR